MSGRDAPASLEARGAGDGTGEQAAPVRARVAEPAAATIPRATYRVQLHAAFTLADAAAIVPYLARLGISHLYASPILKARPGSTHGYDIVEHDTINPELGTRADLERLSARLREHGMGLVLDIVPNHMGIGADNPWWMDVLANGPASERAEFFDVDWRPAKPELRGRVLLPVLGDHYGDVLDRGELVLEYAADAGLGTLTVRYWDARFPLDPRTYPDALDAESPALAAALAGDPDTLARFQTLARAFAKLPPRDAVDAEARAERTRDAAVHRRTLAELIARSPRLAAHVVGAVAAFAAPDARGRLHALLERQAWRLAFWRTAADEINYRRFFDINDLAGLRQERRVVFEATHRRIAELVGAGIVDGLRIDHPDGLREPARYYAELQARMGDALRTSARRGSDDGPPATGADGARRDEPAPPPRGAAGAPPARPLYVVAEKILQAHERLPADWAVHGTTGYEFAPLVTGWLTYAPAERAVFRAYQQFTGLHQDLDDELYVAKRLVMDTALASELTVLANGLNRVSEADVHTRDYTLNALRAALEEVAACFPVYRTYVTPDGGASAEDRRHVDWAIAQARKRSTAVDRTVFDFVRRVLLLEGFDAAPSAVRDDAVGVAMRFQQFTAPLMAKGFEDTVLYRFHALVASNEVGGTPRRYHTSAAALHRANAERARDWPHAMLTTSTHDTKRSEDVRARLCVLTERIDEWRERVQRWARFNHRRKRRVRADTAWPGPRIEYLLYQTLVGTWPHGEFDRAAYRARIHAYALKATREAKTHTSWVNPDAAYERALAAFVDALLPDAGGGPFLADFEAFAREIAWFGALGSLSQQLLKLTSPGVPDVYQGTEALDFSLVDPDNRRPVDYAWRSAELARPGTAANARALLDDPVDGRAKLHLTAATLRLRATHDALFRDGDYVPLDVTGERADHVLAFARRHAGRSVVVIATRWHATLTERAIRLPLGRAVWGDTAVALPPGLAGPRRCVLTGERVAGGDPGGRALTVGDLLAAWPVALLPDDA